MVPYSHCGAPACRQGWEKTGLGWAAQGIFFVICWSEWRRGDSKLLLPKTCKVYCRFGGGAMGFVFVVFSLRLRMLVQ